MAIDKTEIIITLGSFETVTFPEIGLFNVVAKVDTGAYSGAIHCSKIELIQDKEKGTKLLRFIPSDTGKAVDFYRFKVVAVKSSHGHIVRRFIIETVMIIRDQPYRLSIGLADRSNMQKEVLIGRRFLRKNNMLVDVRMAQKLDTGKREEI